MLDRTRFTVENLHKMIESILADAGIKYTPLDLTKEELCMLYEDLEYWWNYGASPSVLNEVYKEYCEEVA